VSADAIAFATLCVLLIGALVGFVRSAAVSQTSHEIRIAALEKSHDEASRELREEIKELRGIVGTLKDTVADLHRGLAVNKERTRAITGGAFDQGDSDRPQR